MSLSAREETERVRPRLYRPPALFPYVPKPWCLAEIFETTSTAAYTIGNPEVGDAKFGELAVDPDIAIMLNRSRYGGKITRDELVRNLYRDGIHDLGTSVPDNKFALLAFLTRSAVKNSAPQLLSLQFNDNGAWSYRPPCEMGCGGNGSPTQLDIRGNLITNVLEADFGAFDEFLGFASIPKEGILCFPRLSVDNKLFVSP